FARFGARLDDETRKTIAHGRRIRACLNQAEYSPVPVPAQIAILLALTGELFDEVSLDEMKDAEKAVLDAAEKIPDEVIARFETADKLSDGDREVIVGLAAEALESFRA
ncbi:hypothetical protein N9C66_08315, partial [Akkermansiaceae bacterium]|nr:hypothetical protein [Akkermansiaceae bacterium]